MHLQKKLNGYKNVARRSATQLRAASRRGHMLMWPSNVTSTKKIVRSTTLARVLVKISFDWLITHGGFRGCNHLPICGSSGPEALEE